MECEGVDRIDLDHNRDQWQGLVNTETSFQNSREFDEVTINFPRNTLFHEVSQSVS
jgi:hypothetical protein